MSRVSPHIEQFFIAYEKGANTFDVDLNVSERASSWLAADPNGVAVVNNDDAFPALIRERHQQLLELGYIGAKITSLEELPLDTNYSLVKTAWQQTYRTEGATKTIAITVDYLVRIDAGKTVTIIASIAHEDEAELLRAASIRTNS